MSLTKSLRVFIVEDNQLTRLGLRFALEQESGFELFGEASDADLAVEQILKLKPDVVLMDIELLGLSGPAATRLIKTQAPEVRVIMLTSYDDDDKIFASFSAGADGYCLKRLNTDQLLEAMRAVSDGRGWIDPAIADRVIAWSEQSSATATASDSEMQLSP